MLEQILIDLRGSEEEKKKFIDYIDSKIKQKEELLNSKVVCIGVLGDVGCTEESKKFINGWMRNKRNADIGLSLGDKVIIDNNNVLHLQGKNMNVPYDLKIYLVTEKETQLENLAQCYSGFVWDGNYIEFKHRIVQNIEPLKY